MANTEREEKILQLLKEKKSMEVAALASLLYVSEATVRRDLAHLQRMGVIGRSHGGAFLQDQSGDPSILIRLQKNQREKERVAHAALSVLPSDCKTVFLDSSTTAYALACRMDLSYRTVVTNQVQFASQLSHRPHVTVILLGGVLDRSSNSLLGSWTVGQLAGFSFDLMIASCAAIQGKEALERSLDQREIKYAALQRSKYKILLADRTKFGARGDYTFAPLSAFDHVVTEGSE